MDAIAILGVVLINAAIGLAPNDIVLLQSGDNVPADLRLFRIKRLQV